MDKINVSLLLICCIFGVVVYGYETKSEPNGKKVLANSWCISNIQASQDSLLGLINYGCGVVDCSAIQPGGLCYDPNTITSHANYVLNQIYVKNRTCDWHVGMVVQIDPSYGNCKYP
ncbi:hypothetical protein ABFS83_07G060800 [Erythranthe nasuta]